MCEMHNALQGSGQQGAANKTQTAANKVQLARC
jgi:hypothetical protein